MDLGKWQWSMLNAAGVLEGCYETPVDLEQSPGEGYEEVWGSVSELFCDLYLYSAFLVMFLQIIFLL